MNKGDLRVVTRFSSGNNTESELDQGYYSTLLSISGSGPGNVFVEALDDVDNGKFNYVFPDGLNTKDQSRIAKAHFLLGK